jgi:hypothetical protein
MPDRWDRSEWRALYRESALSMRLIGSGVTALGRADYGDNLGEYYVAFFGVSQGLERLCKLIAVVDLTIESGGQLPPPAFVKSLGHKLRDMVERASQIQMSRGISLTYGRPTSEITWRALRALDSFADAQRGRYANFSPDMGSLLDEHEPIARWWSDVCEPILSDHYYGRAAESRASSAAAMSDRHYGAISHVLFLDELGRPITDVAAATLQSHKNQVAQRFGRYYVLLLVRWLANIFCELSRVGTYEHQNVVLFGHGEHFNTFLVDGQFLKNRKRWPL